MKNPKHFNSSIIPGNGITAPLRMVLHESHSSTAARPEYVTHCQNMQDGGFFNGHYFRAGDGIINPAYSEMKPAEAYAAALADYVERCIQLGVDPIPSEGIQMIPPGIARPVRTEQLPGKVAFHNISEDPDHVCDKCGKSYQNTTENFDGFCPDCIRAIDAGELATLPPCDC